MAEKNLSNAFSTGDGGGHFENHVQSSYVVLMLTGGFVPTLPSWSIDRIALQGKVEGYSTDDMIVTVSQENNKFIKLLCQIKHQIMIQNSNKIFQEVIDAAWADFNNPNLFDKGIDKIALITGVINRTDYKLIDVLNQAKSVDDVDVFYNRLEQGQFLSDAARTKFEVLRNSLKIANNAVEPSRKQIFDFAKSFHILIYDVGREQSVVLSLIRSHMAQYCYGRVEKVWGRITDIVAEHNQNAGIITRAMLPEDILEEFSDKKRTVVKQHFEEQDIQQDINFDIRREDQILLLRLAMIGSWNDKNDKDKQLIADYLNEDYDTIIDKIREYIDSDNALITVKGTVWSFNNRMDIYSFYVEKLIESDFDKFSELSLDVLSETDKTYLDDNSTALMYSSNLFSYSNEIRKGVSEGLAIIGNVELSSNRCGVDYNQSTINSILVKLLRDSDWRLWISLESLFPLLCESSPTTFLKCMQEKMTQDVALFEELFSKEGSGIFGRNYMTGILWSLEKLAWFKEYFYDSILVTVDLAKIDHGGTWANRPINSLIDIFLPWHPQTLVSFQDKQNVINVIITRYQSVAYELLVKLLPYNMSSTSGTVKPIIIPIEIPEKIAVTHGQYFAEVDWYSNRLVDFLEDNLDYLSRFIDHMHSLTRNAFDRFLNVLKSDKVVNLPDANKVDLWDELQDFINHHMRFPDADWSLDKEDIEKLLAINEIVAPQNKLLKARRLFSYDTYKLMNDNGDYKEQREAVEALRVDTLDKVCSENGIDGIMKLCELVESPYNVGYSLSFTEQLELIIGNISSFILSRKDYQNLFLKGFLNGCFVQEKMEIVNEIFADRTQIEERIEIAVNLPFQRETWKSLDEWLGEQAISYWEHTEIYTFLEEDDTYYVVEKLNAVKRFDKSIQCIYSLIMHKKDFDTSIIEYTLLELVKRGELLSSSEHHGIEKLITYLQKNSLNTDNMIAIEWAYLPLLSGKYNPNPITIIKHMSSNPEFYCQIIRMCYKSKYENKTEKVSSGIANNAWTALSEWNLVPGQSDDQFSFKEFEEWFAYVSNSTSESGHYEVALQKVGEVLINTPADDDLWIDSDIAGVVELLEHDHIRRGFRTALFNSRGVHTVDPSGSEDLALSEKYRAMGDDLKEHGYIRFSNVLYDLAKTYLHESKVIQMEHDE